MRTVDNLGGVERGSTDVVTVDGLTVEFAVRYVTGEEGARVEARQAEALAALADWVALAGRNHDPDRQH